MDPELKELLRENLAVSKNNNEILRAIRHHQWLGMLTSTVFWIVVVVAPLFIYQQYLLPLVSKWSATTGTTTSGPFGLPTSADIQKLINSYKAGQTTR